MQSAMGVGSFLTHRVGISVHSDSGNSYPLFQEIIFLPCSLMIHRLHLVCSPSSASEIHMLLFLDGFFFFPISHFLSSSGSFPKLYLPAFILSFILLLPFLIFKGIFVILFNFLQCPVISLLFTNFSNLIIISLYILFSLNSLSSKLLISVEDFSRIALIRLLVIKELGTEKLTGDPKR